MPEPGLNEPKSLVSIMALAAGEKRTGCQGVWVCSVPVVDTKVNVAVVMAIIVSPIMAGVMMLFSFHAAVMLFECMFVRIEAGVPSPWTIVMTIGMMPLIVSVPAWNMTWPVLVMAHLMTFTIVVGEFWWSTSIACMPVTCGSILWNQNANGSNRGQQQRRNSYLLVHDVPPCDR